MRRLGGHVWQRARGGAADAGASGLVDRPSRRAPESSEGRDARREDLVAWPAGLDVAGRGLARGQTLRKSMWVMVSLINHRAIVTTAQPRTYSSLLSLTSHPAHVSASPRSPWHEPPQFQPQPRAASCAADQHSY